MTLWIIEPHDTLIARDARPFSASAGARARTLPFPPPSVVAGAARGRSATSAAGSFDHPNPIELLTQRYTGPFLVELDTAGQINDWWFPAPADGIAFRDDATGTLTLMPLHPQAVHGITSNLPDGLLPVILAQQIAHKPVAQHWWSWRTIYRRWLLGAATQVLQEHEILGNLTVDQRMHVTIDPATRTVQDEGGSLFMTAGLSFRRGMKRQFALAIDTATDLTTAPAALTMGGERRIVTWAQSAERLPGIPQELVETITQQKRCRVLLLTPAFYSAGWRPDELLRTVDGVSVTLVAAAGGKPVVQSGWELATRTSAGGPKPSRRFAPAGTVYWVTLAGTDEAIAAWVRRIWFRSISDTPQDQTDGAGIALVATYS